MVRVTSTAARRKRSKKILKRAKGYYGRHKNVIRIARNRTEKGLLYAYRDRRARKRDFRALWIQRINASVRAHGLTYSQLMSALAKKGMALNRKMLADLAVREPAAFANLVRQMQVDINS